ncbi:FecR family protein [Brevundimonas sp.]|uniref:FecR family protein n=1 Tax=Brevundimonas sp. TaxID=1871086 RepID=UPI002ED78B62
MASTSCRPDNDDHTDPAAFWFARMNSGGAVSPEDEIRFRRWLDEDPENSRAYRSCQLAWRLLELDAGEPEVLALRSAALGPGYLGPGARRLTRRRALFGLTGGAVAASCGGLWVMTSASSARALISTEAGQRLTAPLPDGSEVTLAPSSRLRLDYAADRRAAVLEAGQAYFQIRPDSAPFVLRAGNQMMAAVQGQFQITCRGQQSEVVVEQGRLRMSDRRDESATLMLTAGQGGRARTGELQVAPVDVEVETAWRLGRLVVRDRPLREVVDLFNRYASDRLAVDDAAAGEVRISGSFRYDGGREFALALAHGFNLSARQTADGVWRVGSRVGSADGAATL